MRPGIPWSLIESPTIVSFQDNVSLPGKISELRLLGSHTKHSRKPWKITDRGWRIQIQPISARFHGDSRNICKHNKPLSIHHYQLCFPRGFSHHLSEYKFRDEKLFNGNFEEISRISNSHIPQFPPSNICCIVSRNIQSGLCIPWRSGWSTTGFCYHAYQTACQCHRIRVSAHVPRLFLLTHSWVLPSPIDRRDIVESQ